MTGNDGTRDQLEFFRDIGVQDLFLERAAAKGPASVVPGSTPDLAALQKSLEGCPRCKLSGTRTNIVFGQGNPSAELMFVGEAPGRDEDEQGLAFVGRAGQLLTKIIEAIGRKREDVFIANVLKCRPPNNRNPEPDEVAACRPFLDEQIRLIAPRVIVTLGTFAAQAILETDESIGRLRGRWRAARGVRVMPTFHPAFLLRSPERKKDVWEDMKLVRDFLATK
ncbi:MAG TPA: uracil-DNA glycosylase [Thermoanaerobaculia bacterium]|nr:uracil-DNA glycosylase [Thermoanaerobaculia bacterium]